MLHCIYPPGCLGTITCRCYIDDTVVSGLPEELNQALPHVFLSICAELPYPPMNPRLWSGALTMKRFSDMMFWLSLPSSPEGILVCGHALTADPQDEQLPFGGCDYVAQWCQSALCT